MAPGRLATCGVMGKFVFGGDRHPRPQIARWTLQTACGPLGWQRVVPPVSGKVKERVQCLIGERFEKSGHPSGSAEFPGLLLAESVAAVRSVEERNCEESRFSKLSSHWLSGSSSDRGEGVGRPFKASYAYCQPVKSTNYVGTKALSVIL